MTVIKLLSINDNSIATKLMPLLLYFNIVLMQGPCSLNKDIGDYTSTSLRGKPQCPNKSHKASLGTES